MSASPVRPKRQPRIGQPQAGIDLQARGIDLVEPRYRNLQILGSLRGLALLPQHDGPVDTGCECLDVRGTHGELEKAHGQREAAKSLVEIVVLLGPIRHQSGAPGQAHIAHLHRQRLKFVGQPVVANGLGEPLGSVSRSPGLVFRKGQLAGQKCITSYTRMGRTQRFERLPWAPRLEQGEAVGALPTKFCRIERHSQSTMGHSRPPG